MFSLNDRSIRLKQVGPLLGGSLVEPKIAQLVCLTNYFGVVSCRCDGDLRSLREVRTAQQWSVRRLWPCAIQHGGPQAVPHGACVHGTVPPKPGQCARHHERESGATWTPRDEVGSSTGSRTCSEVCWGYARFHLPACCVSGTFHTWVSVPAPVMGVVGDVAGIRFSLMCLYASLGVVRCPGCVDAYTVAFAWHVSQFGVCASMTTFTPAVTIPDQLPRLLLRSVLAVCCAAGHAGMELDLLAATDGTRVDVALYREISVLVSPCACPGIRGTALPGR